MAAKVFSLPGTIRALAFDMDLTLYTSPEYGWHQIDSLVKRLGEKLGLSFEEMNEKVEGLKASWAFSHGGKMPSLSHIMAGFGIGMEENIRWREEIYEPGRFIKEDPKLRETLRELSRSFVLGVVTNNPVLVARKTLAVLGVESYFPIIVGLDTCMTAKPHETPFRMFCGLSGCPPEACVSVGDRDDIDLDIPLEMGMGGILVEGVEDVYRLPESLGAGYGV
jgi:phosphoglycolate phosphatase/putative hydrolase of the HAD superfamily